MHSIIACGSALVITSALAGCSSPAPAAIHLAGAWTTRTLDLNQVSLSVPSNWNVGEAWVQSSSFSDLVGSFSNQPLSLIPFPNAPDNHVDIVVCSLDVADAVGARVIGSVRVTPLP